MRRNPDYENVEIFDGKWHEVKKPKESTQYVLGFLYEKTDDYILESCIFYREATPDDDSIPERFKYASLNRLTITNPNINPLNARDQERFTSYQKAKDFIFRWNEDAYSFIKTITENPNEELLMKYYRIQAENGDYDNILEFVK